MKSAAVRPTDSKPKPRAKRLAPEGQREFTFQAPDGATLVYTSPKALDVDAVKAAGVAFESALKEEAPPAPAPIRLRDLPPVPMRFDGAIVGIHDRITRALWRMAAWRTWNGDEREASRRLSYAAACANVGKVSATTDTQIHSIVNAIIADVSRLAPSKGKKKGKGGEPPKAPPAPPVVAKAPKAPKAPPAPPPAPPVVAKAPKAPKAPPAPLVVAKAPKAPKAPPVIVDPKGTDLLNEALGFVSAIQRASHSRPDSVSADARALAESIDSLCVHLADGGAFPVQWMRRRVGV